MAEALTQPSAKDSPAAAELAKVLASRGHEVLARDSGGNPLRLADAMVVLVSPESAGSPFVRREIEFALESPRFAHRLIPIFLGSSLNAPWILRKLQPFRAGDDLALTGRRVAQALEKTA